MKNLELSRPLAIIDLETTGINRQEDRIVEICIIKVSPNGKEEILESLVNPEVSIPIIATQFHGIKDVDVKEKPTFKELALEILNFIDNCDLCGFNIVGFDLYFLESEFKRAGVNYSAEGRKVIDVMKIYHKLEPRDLNSAHLKYCGKPLENTHRAHSDAKATINVLEAQLEKNNHLPSNVSELHEYCNPKDISWIDNEGKIIWDNSESTIGFGKHKGKTLNYMQKNELSYLQWMMDSDFSIEVKTIVKNAMNGEFPIK